MIIVEEVLAVLLVRRWQPVEPVPEVLKAAHSPSTARCGGVLVDLAWLLKFSLNRLVGFEECTTHPNHLE